MIDFDALVLAAGQDAFSVPAALTPLVSQPGVAAFPIRGIYALKPSDIVDGDNAITRADDYTFSVRVAEFLVPAARGDQVSGIMLPFLAGKVFVIDDTGDDGFGAQQWVLKLYDANDDEP